MQREVVRVLIQFFDRIHFFHAVGLENGRIGDKRIVGDHVHAHRLALAAHQPAHVAVSMDTEGLALNLGTRAGREAVAGHENHHGERQFGHGVGVLARSVHHHDAACGSRREVHVVVTGTGTHHDLEVPRRFDDFGRHLVAADNQRIHVGHGREQFRFVGIFFEQGQFVSGAFDDLTDAVYGLLGKGLFRRNQYFHTCIFD